MKDNGLAPASQPPPAPAPDRIDDALLARVHRGDRMALEDLVRRHHASVTRLVHRLAGYAPDADDLVQEVFFHAVCSLPKFDGRSSVPTWLTRIAINVCRTHHRRRFFRASFWSGLRSHAPPESTGHPHERLDTAERDHRVRTAVASLPPTYRQVIVLHYLEQKSLDDTARLLDVSKNAAEVRLHRARKLLESKLRDLVTE